MVQHCGLTCSSTYRTCCVCPGTPSPPSRPSQRSGSAAIRDKAGPAGAGDRASQPAARKQQNQTTNRTRREETQASVWGASNHWSACFRCFLLWLTGCECTWILLLLIYWSCYAGEEAEMQTVSQALYNCIRNWSCASRNWGAASWDRSGCTRVWGEWSMLCTNMPCDLQGTREQHPMFQQGLTAVLCYWDCPGHNLMQRSCLQMLMPWMLIIAGPVFVAGARKEVCGLDKICRWARSVFASWWSYHWWTKQARQCCRPIR